MGRDNGRGKRGGRGHGKKSFIANIEELNLREGQVRQAQAARIARRGEDDSDESGDEIANDTGGTDDSVFSFANEPKQGLLASVATGKKANAPMKNIKYKDLAAISASAPVVSADAGMSRKEREAFQQARAKEEYQRKTMAGETEEAKRNLARLEEVKRRREEAAKTRDVEGRKSGMSKTGLPDYDDDDDDDGGGDGNDGNDSEGSSSGEESSDDEPKKPISSGARSSATAAKKRAQAAGAVEDTSKQNVPKLKSIEIKKMNPTALKGALKERNLSIQGQKKDLMQRLIDYEK